MFNLLNCESYLTSVVHVLRDERIEKESNSILSNSTIAHIFTVQMFIYIGWYFFIRKKFHLIDYFV